MKSLLVAISIFLLASLAHSANLTVEVVDAAGAPVPDAAVYAEIAGARSLAKPPQPAQHPVQIEQKARQFAPLVTVVQTGSTVSFPNHDTVRHQVYSFSPAKVFELKLYAGAGGDPITFDKAGTVIVGCNIHDRMLAYIHVVDTPYFAKTDASGTAKMANLPAGKYVLKIWHPRLSMATAAQEQPLTTSNSDLTLPVTVNFTLSKKSD